jgi:Immunity protein 53
MSVLEPIAWLEEFLSGQSESYWNGQGITIKSLDNPGWELIITIPASISVNDRPSKLIEGDADSETHWMFLSVERNTLHIFGGPKMLGKMILRAKEFLEQERPTKFKN